MVFYREGFYREVSYSVARCALRQSSGSAVPPDDAPAARAPELHREAKDPPAGTSGGRSAGWTATAV
ncbi:hypothetical protein ASE96_02480 [Arthrobacter sp. Leaf69]|nr:hypothetical protein ASE96_02480 [Arthrobacter sp. Leaf69]